MGHCGRRCLCRLVGRGGVGCHDPLGRVLLRCGSKRLTRLDFFPPRRCRDRRFLRPARSSRGSGRLAGRLLHRCSGARRSGNRLISSCFPSLARGCRPPDLGRLLFRQGPHSCFLVFLLLGHRLLGRRSADFARNDFFGGGHLHLRRFPALRGGFRNTSRGLSREFLLCRRAPRLCFRLPSSAFPCGSNSGRPSRSLHGRHYSILLCCPALETGPTGQRRYNTSPLGKPNSRA